MTAKLVGYFENWAQYRPAGGKCLPEQIDPSLFTHINFAFGLFGFVTWSVDPTPTRTGDQRLTGDYRIQPVEWNDQTALYPALQQLKQKNPTLKTLLSIGGWSINSCDDQPNAGNPHPYGPYTCHLFSHMAADPQGRQQFIQSAIAYAHQYGFDGIDIDWEYPGYSGRGGAEADFENFLRLLQEFRAQAGSNFLLTWAAPAIVSTGGSASSPQNDPTTYFQWVAQCAQSCDWLNVMSYDFHGAFDDPIQVGTGVNAPLVQDSTPNGPFSIKNTVEAYLHAGIPKDKIVLGLPTYGRNFTVSSPLTDTDHGYGKPFRDAGPAGPATQVPGVLAYYEILAQLANGTLVKQWDNATLTPYAYSSQTGEWVSYDDADSLAYKVSYLLEQGLGGAMVWSIDNDDFSNGFPLLNSIKSVLDNPALRKPLPNALLAGPVATASHYLWDATGFLGVPTTLLQFKDDGVKRPGVRQFSARLWNVPLGGDWKTVAEHAPAVIKRQYFNRPTRIVDKGVLGLWGEFDVRDTSDVPDWYWGHMETVEGAPSGFKRYRSRLWGLSLKDDWKAAARKTPALIEGQYFDQPTEIDDQGVRGIYGVFDVSNGTSTVPALVAEAQGPNDCSYCLIDTIPPQGNVALVNLTSTMTVTPGTPYLYAVLTRDNDSVDFPAGVVMTIQDPSGANYDHDIQDDNQLVMMSGPSVRCLIVKDPKPGDWTMAMSAPSGVGFHCECNTAPNADIFDTMVRTRQQLGETQGLVPRDISGSQVLAYLAMGTITLLVPLPLSLTVRALIWVTGVGLGIVLKGTSKAAVSQNMAEVAGILSKITRDVQQEGYSAVGKYVTLIGKNISLEEYQVILRYPGNLFHWLGVHRRVYQVVEHMTDAEEQNAVRHVYWQCLLKKRLGEEFAIAMGDAHERGRPGSDADNKADEINNKIGLQLADQVESEEECLQRAGEMWQAGQLAKRTDIESDPT